MVLTLDPAVHHQIHVLSNKVIVTMTMIALVALYVEKIIVVDILFHGGLTAVKKVVLLC